MRRRRKDSQVVTAAAWSLRQVAGPSADEDPGSVRQAGSSALLALPFSSRFQRRYEGIAQRFNLGCKGARLRGGTPPSITRSGSVLEILSIRHRDQAARHQPGERPEK
jgi:hypothetical protein